MFAKSDGLTPSAEDAAWWDANGCRRSPIDTHDHTYFQLAAPLPLDDARVVAVSQAVGALESYGAANLSYRVVGGGANGNGQGWYQLDNDGSYPDSIVSVLVAGGHLDGGNVLVDPLDTNAGHSSYDFLVYRCEDRVGVFAKSDGLTPSAEDAAWWDANGCRRSPIDTHDHTYFQLAAPLPLDDARVVAVSQAVGALESYGAANLSYRVVGGGANGNGQGWYQLDNDGSYPDSIVSVLVAGGHLDGGNVLVDPLDTNAGHSSYDFLVYRCEDRVGVFAKSDGLTPSAEDAAWWDANGCRRSPIDTHDHTYFQLAAPLPLDDARVVAVSQAVGALESYGAANLSYRVVGGGANGMVRVGISSTMMVRIRIRLCRCWLLGAPRWRECVGGSA